MFGSGVITGRGVCRHKGEVVTKGEVVRYLQVSVLQSTAGLVLFQLCNDSIENSINDDFTMTWKGD